MALPKLVDNFDIFGTRKNQKGADGALNSSLGLTSEYADKMGSLGEANVARMQELASMILGNAEQYKQDNSQAIEDSNRNYEASRQQQNADLASMGYTPSSNSVYANSNAANAREKATMAANLQNQANAANLSAGQSALTSAGTLENTGYGNHIGALGTALNARVGANNALAANYQNQYNQGMNMFGNVLGLAGKSLGGFAG